VIDLNEACELVQNWDNLISLAAIALKFVSISTGFSHFRVMRRWKSMSTMVTGPL
jgi:hypothetical protein